MRYFDSEGVPTIGIGFNLQRTDARVALETAGVPANEVDAVMNGSEALTQTQIGNLFQYAFKPILSEATDSLSLGTFGRLSDARRFVICDLCYNLGYAGWLSFGETRSIIAQAQEAKDAGDDATASHLFGQAADHLEASLWYTQTGNRAKRDVAMMRASVWCDPYGDGSDISA